MSNCPQCPYDGSEKGWEKNLKLSVGLLCPCTIIWRVDSTTDTQLFTFRCFLSAPLMNYQLPYSLCGWFLERCRMMGITVWVYESTKGCVLVKLTTQSCTFANARDALVSNNMVKRVMNWWLWQWLWGFWWWWRRADSDNNDEENETAYYMNGGGDVTVPQPAKYLAYTSRLDTITIAKETCKSDFFFRQESLSLKNVQL